MTYARGVLFYFFFKKYSERQHAVGGPRGLSSIAKQRLAPGRPAASRVLEALTTVTPERGGARPGPASRRATTIRVGLSLSAS
jgi:hypothetical protein